MAYTYSGTAGAAGATIAVTGTETLASLKTSLASNPTWATVDGSTIIFNATLSIGSGTTTGNWTATDCTLIFPSAYTFTIPNNTAQSGSATNLTDTTIIFDVTAKSYGNAICYGTHTWTRVVYRSQITSGRTDLFQNTGCVFAFNNVQLTVSSTATSYPYDFIHLYNDTTVTLQGLTITGAGGTGSANSFEVGSLPGTTTTFQGLTLGGVFGVITVNNNSTTYTGSQDFRSLSWPLATNWAFNPGGGGATLYITNPNKPSGWTTYSFLTGGAGGTGNLTERYSHDITAVNSAATGVVGVNSGDYRSGAFVWTASSGSGGVVPTQYVTTATLIGTAPGTLTNYSTSVTTAAWLYGYNTYVGGRTFTPTGVGITDALLMGTDVTTLSSTAVAALTSLATLDNLYDASRYWNTLNSTNIQVPALGSNIITANGTQLNLGSYNLVINSGTTTAGNAFSVSGSTITIYSSALAPGTKFTSFTTTGTITVNTGVTVTAPFTTTSAVTNNGTINTQYTSSAGTSGVLTLNNLQSGSSIYIVPNNGQPTQITASSSTSNTYYIPPNSGSTAGTWKVAKYGYLPATGTFTSNTTSSATVVQNLDTYITQSNSVTVGNYASLGSPDQCYDYAAYYETLTTGGTPGISFTRASTASGKNLSFGSNTVTLNTGASAVYAISGAAVTIKATSPFTTGTTFTSFGSTAAVTLTGLTYGTTLTCVYTSSGLTSTALTLTNLPYTSNNGGTYLSILNGSNAQVQYVGPITSGSTIIYIAPAAASTYTWKAACYSYQSGTGTFAVGSTNGYQSATVSLVGDPGVTTPAVATVAGYTTLGTLDKLYDYAAYIQTQNSTSGITITNPLTKNGSTISAGANAIVFNTTASPIFSVSSGTITICSTATFATGVTFTAISTTSGTFTQTGVTVTCVYSTSAGQSTVLTFSNVPSANVGSSIAIYNASTPSAGAQVQFFNLITAGSQVVLIAPVASATYSWKIACYTFLPQTSQFTTGGYVNVTISLGSDPGYTATQAAAAAYTTLASPDQIYDYAAYWETTSTGIPVTRVTSKSGTQLSFSSGVAVTLSTSASAIYTATTTTATIKSASSFGPGTTYISFATNSTVTLTGLTYGTTMTCPYSSSAGTTTVITLTGLVAGSSVQITNNSGVQQQFIGSSTSPQVIYVGLLASQTTYNWKIAAYGSIAATGTTTVGSTTTLYQSVSASLATDTGITNSSKSSVQAYTSFSTLDQIYDYLAYWETTNNTGGIQVTRPVTKNGTSISFGSNNVTFSSTTGTTYAYTAGTPNSLVFETSATLNPGATTFQQINTSGTVTLTSVTLNFIYTSGAGTSAILTLTGLPANSYVYVQNAAGVQQTYQSGQSGTFSYPTAPGASSGSWAWSTKAIGYTPAAGTYTPASGGITSIAVSCPQIFQVTGAVMYQGSTNTLCTVSFTGSTVADIFIGNGQVTVQNVFDVAERALVTSAGTAWLASGLSGIQIFTAPTGNFLFLTHNWRLKALNTSSPNAQILGFPLSTDGTPIDSGNGNILVFSTTQASDTATAVWNYALSAVTTVGTAGETLTLAQAAATLAAALSA